MEERDLESMIWEIHSQRPITVNVNQKSVGEVQFSCGCSDPNAHGNEDYPMVLYTTRFHPPAPALQEFIICRHFGIRGACNTVFASAVIDEIPIESSLTEFDFEEWKTQKEGAESIVECACGAKIPEWFLEQSDAEQFACCQCWGAEAEKLVAFVCRCGGCGPC